MCQQRGGPFREPLYRGSSGRFLFDREIHSSMQFVREHTFIVIGPGVGTPTKTPREKREE